MSELNKTLIFVGLAGASLVAAVLGRPTRIASTTPDQIVGQPLFPKFTDPFEARGLEVTTYDPGLDSVQSFEIAQKEGKWVVPSHEGYPADAEERLKNAATLLVGLKSISIESDRREDHAKYGVLQPDPTKTESGDTGVGKMVVFRSAKGDRLAELIMGKAVRGTEGRRYVRIPGKDRVYTCNLDPDELSTRFEDWIKQDLLEVSGFDISEMEIKDYSCEPQFTGQGLVIQIAPRFQLVTTWNAKDYKWDLKKLEEFKRREYQPRELAANEELHKENLDAMKSALEDLKIVDVRKKPDGLRPSMGIKPDVVRDEEAMRSLLEHGFYPQPQGDDLSYLCSDGEIAIHTKDGVEYKLLFGDQAASIDEKGKSQLNRFVMVSANVDPTAFEKPVLELPPESSPTPQPPPEEPSSAPASDDSSPQDATAPEEAAETDENEVPAEAVEVPETNDSAPAADPEREKLVKDYERKLEEYNDNVAKAQEKARTLNFRLGDWYYVVSEDVYRRIHLSRGQVIRVKEGAASDQDDVDAFRQLEEKGPQEDSKVES
ncbi:MAG TPA: DUF4340 domain-containing protein [Pirellulaceae bacterium]